MVNKLITIGRQTADPTLRTVGNSEVVNFNLASDTRNKDKDGKKITNFYRVAVWGKPGAACMQCLHKGDKAYVEGELSSRLYQANNGETKLSLEISATDVKFLSERSVNSTNNAQATTKSNEAADNSDELPF